MTRLKWKLILVHFEIVLMLTQDRCKVKGTGILIFRQVEVTIVVTENDTPIQLQIKRSNPAIIAPQLL